MAVYEVSVQGYGSAVYYGETAGQARANAWRSFQSARECSFKEFLKISSVRRTEMPGGAGYEYVRRAYGVDVKAGDQVELHNEHSWNGTVGTVVYPGQSTAHVHVKVPGIRRPLIVHPDNVRALSPTDTERSET